MNAGVPMITPDATRRSTRAGIASSRRLAPARALLGVALALQFSCSLLVDTAPPPQRAAAPEGPGGVAPLTAGEKLYYFFDNLGEIEPGLAYRASEPSLSLVKFLVERAKLRHVVNLKKSNRMPWIKEYIESQGGTYTHIPMSASHPPTPRKVLELIRITLQAKQEGSSFVMHCHGGADRTGMMTGIWRMLFQGVTDREALRREATFFRHVPPAHPNVFQIIDLFPVELFRPFIENPALLNDEEAIAELETRFFKEYPLRSGSTVTRSGRLRAGAAKRNLLEGLSEQVQMATYGPFPSKSSSVREPVFARAVVLENDGMRLAVVSCDLLITDETIRRMVGERLAAEGVPLHDILLAATHAHTSVGAYVNSWIYELYMFGPYEEKVRDHLVARIVDAVKEAAASVQPARLGTGNAFVEGLSYNRRVGTQVDPQVGIIRITDPGGAPIATMVNFAAHPVLALPDGMISSDYPGILNRKLDEALGFGIFLGGALGDQNAQAPGAHGWGSRHPEDPQRVADALFAAIARVVPEIETREEIRLGSMTMSFRLPPFNANPIPDLLFPIKWLAEAAIPWPEYAPLQGVRLGDIALVATSSEFTVALGLDVKRRSPVERTFVVTHSNAYTGYATNQVNYPKGKVDPTSVVSLNGPTHGIKTVNAALDIVRELWKGEEPRAAAPDETATRSEADPAGEAGANSPTLPQSRRFDHFVRDNVPDKVRLETSFSYLEHLRGGDGLRGRRREATARVGVHGPWDLELDLEGGYVRSEWRTSGGREGDEGPTDLAFGIQRAFLIAEDELEGHGLRGIPRIATTAPTGDAGPSAPFAFASAAGVWRPSAGGALELTWSTYRTITLESFYTTAIDRYHRRRPGDRWESLLTYSERHGLASLFLGLHTTLQLKDRRTGGLQEVDVQDRSFAVGLRPGISLHLGEHVELFGSLSVPLYRDADGASEGRGGIFGLMIGF